MLVVQPAFSCKSITDYGFLKRLFITDTNSFVTEIQNTSFNDLTLNIVTIYCVQIPYARQKFELLSPSTHTLTKQISIHTCSPAGIGFVLTHCKHNKFQYDSKTCQTFWRSLKSDYMNSIFKPDTQAMCLPSLACFIPFEFTIIQWKTSEKWGRPGSIHHVDVMWLWGGQRRGAQPPKQRTGSLVRMLYDSRC